MDSTEGMGIDGRKKFTEGLSDFIFVRNAVLSSDIIFVPGNGYPQMAEEAAVLYRKGMADRILPSGKYWIADGFFTGAVSKREMYAGPYQTEWEFLKDVLERNGVPEAAILKEDTATFTFENAIRSRQVTDREGIEVRRGIICCLSGHARRCLMYYQMLYPEAELLIDPVPANGITKENWTKSDEGIEFVLGEATRCGSQFETVLKAMKDI